MARGVTTRPEQVIRARRIDSGLNPFPTGYDSGAGTGADGYGYGEDGERPQPTWGGDALGKFGRAGRSLYFTNDVRYLLNNYGAYLGTTQAEGVAILQQAMKDGELLEGDYAYGIPGNETINALTTLMGDANNADVTWDELLMQRINGGLGNAKKKSGGSRGGGGAALPTAEELGLVFDKVTQETLGRYLDPTEKDQMVGQWLGNPTINPGDFAEIQTGRDNPQYGTEFRAEHMGRLGQDLEGLLTQDKPGGRLTGAGY